MKWGESLTHTHTYFINWEISYNKKKIEVAKHRRNNPVILYIYIQCSGRKLYVRILSRSITTMYIIFLFALTFIFIFRNMYTHFCINNLCGGGGCTIVFPTHIYTYLSVKIFVHTVADATTTTTIIYDPPYYFILNH